MDKQNNPIYKNMTNVPPSQLVRSLAKNVIHNLNMEKTNAHIYKRFINF